MSAINNAIRAGDLERAMTLAESEVRDNPTQPSARMVLAEVLMLRGDFERAESHLSAVLRFDADREREVQSCLQLLRAESDRQQVFGSGRTPDFLVPPTESMRLRLGALAHLRSGDHGRAAELLLASAECEPECLAEVVGGCGESEAGSSRAALVDWDSRFGATLEGLTATGKYYWIPLSAIASVEFSPVGSLRDLGWRSAVVTFAGGDRSAGLPANVAFLFVPTRYPESERSEDGLIRAGLATTWNEPLAGVGIGLGQRMFLHGDESVPAVRLAAFRMEADPGDAAAETDQSSDAHMTSEAGRE